MTSPEQIQRNIEGTRAALSADVDRLTEKVSPGRVVGRRVDRIKTGATSLRERVMGSVPDADSVRAVGSSATERLSSAGEAAGSQLSSAGDAVGGALSTVRDAAVDTPQAVRRQTQGNPLAAGLVAFGVGMVLSSLAPASDKEQELASEAEQKAAGPVQEKAKELAGQLQDSAKDSLQQVKDVAAQGASETADEARSAAEDVRSHVSQSPSAG